MVLVKIKKPNGRKGGLKAQKRIKRKLKNSTQIPKHAYSINIIKNQLFKLIRRPSKQQNFIK